MTVTDPTGSRGRSGWRGRERCGRRVPSFVADDRVLLGHCGQGSERPMQQPDATSQMEKMWRVFSPLYEACGLKILIRRRPSRAPEGRLLIW
jgi:hypothetical protein